MTKYEKLRKENMARYRENIGHDSGAYGRIFELECASANSRKTHVGLNGEADLYVKFERGTVKAECKTNGGRIEALYSAKAPKFVIYRLDLTIKHKAGKHTSEHEEVRSIAPVIIPTALFLSKLEEFGAVKSTNGTNPERAIQVSSKKWFGWLSAYPVEYHSDWTYTAEDFEGLC